jgi:asparagine synthase (glutamine-hydrolysing)
MICGSFALSGSGDILSAWGDFYPDNEDLSYHQVRKGVFNGGYYLHRRLPLTGDDFYFYDSENDLLVLSSGYIYNKTEMADSYGFDAGEPVPRTAARLFLDEGPEFVRRVNGDFVIFIAQPANRRAYLFRDQVGIRPVAYSADNGRLIFSSDINGLCRYLAGKKPVSREFLLGFFKYIDLTTTPYDRVRRLLPGHYLEYTESGVRETRYWDPERIKTENSMDYDEMLSELKELVEDAVAIRSDNRFMAGAHVSSGLDSCTVAALARRNYSRQDTFYGYSWSPSGFTPSDPAYDERELVQSLCSRERIEPVFSGLTREEFLDRVSDFYHNKGNYFEEHTLGQAAANGTNLLFSGWGGDEFISTGDRGIETDLLRRLNLRTYFRRNHIRPVKRFIKYFLLYTLLPAVGILQRNVARSFANDARYLKKPFRKCDRKVLRNFYFHTSRRQLHLGYLRFYHIQERCESWMISGYRRGVEYRYPLLDMRIVEYMIRMPSLLLCRTDYFRPLLRITGKDLLPDDVRLNESKRDPVYMELWYELFRHAGLKLMEEVGQWHNNPELTFIDFEKLNEEIALYRRDPASIDSRALFKSLVYMKAVHQFTVRYHEE